MRGAKWIALGGTLAAMLWLGVGVVPGFAPRLADGPLRTRFAQHPPAEGFRFVFSRPVPPRVTGLAASGEAWLAGTNVWVTFTAPPEEVRELLEGWRAEPAKPADLRSFSEGWDETLKRYDPEDKLRWSELYRARRLRCFSHPSREITAWVDLDSNRVYLFVFGT